MVNANLAPPLTQSVRLLDGRAERLRLRVYYNWGLLRLAVVPNEQDRSVVAFRSPLSFLYYVLRPSRLLKNLVFPG